jgi:hypothetical protein
MSEILLLQCKDRKKEGNCSSHHLDPAHFLRPSPFLCSLRFFAAIPKFVCDKGTDLWESAKDVGLRLLFTCFLSLGLS